MKRDDITKKSLLSQHIMTELEKMEKQHREELKRKDTEIEELRKTVVELRQPKPKKPRVT